MFIEEKLQTTLAGEYDLAVCGGGVAGIAAALTAARGGAKVALFERQYMLGGLATAGLVTIYLPLCDGMGNQVTFGVAEELLRLSIADGAERMYPDNWLDGVGSRTEKDKRFEVQFNAQLFAIRAEMALAQAGVDILYGYFLAGVQREGDRVTHVITESKSGRQAWAVTGVIDATGDCDVAVMAGLPTENFRQGNILAGWYYSAGKSGYHLHGVGYADIPDEEKSAANPGAKPLVDRRFGGIDAREVSEFMQLSHRATYSDFLKLRAEDPSAWPVTISTVPQLRMTRRLVGDYTLSNREIGVSFPDSIGQVSNWKQRGPVYDVPARILFNSQVKNLFVAGRCVSVTEPMWDIMRVIPCCALTGEASSLLFLKEK